MFEDLYTKNKGLLFKIAWRYAGACLRDRGVDLEDLAQAGFFGLVKAWETYDADAGKSWAGWAAWFIRGEIRAALGLGRGERAPLHADVIPLDVPIGEDPGGDTALDMIEDESLPAAGEALERADTARAVRAAVDALPEPIQRDAVRLWGMEGMTKARAAEALGITEQACSAAIQAAVKGLRSNRALRVLADVDSLTRFHAHKGVNAFFASSSSVVEDAVLWRERYEDAHTPRRAAYTGSAYTL